MAVFGCYKFASSIYFDKVYLGSTRLFLYYRSYHSARTTPFGPKVNKYRHWRIQNFGLPFFSIRDMF